METVGQIFTDMAGTDLRKRLENAWDRRTCNVEDQFDPELPSKGQCAVTALLLNDFMGGQILRGEVNGGSHYWNRVTMPSGAEFDVDVTRDQFGSDPIELANIEPRTREYLLSNAGTRRRYERLADRFSKAEKKKVDSSLTYSTLEGAAIARMEDPKAEVESQIQELEEHEVQEQIAIQTWMSGFTDISQQCWQTAEDHGWHEGEVDGKLFVEKLCLIHAEVSEALEEYRDGHDYPEIYYGDKGKPEGIPIELADVFIRLADIAVMYGIDLAAAVAEKQAYNETRPYRHGGKKA